MINFERYEDELQKALYDFSKNTGITLPGWKDLVSWGMQEWVPQLTDLDRFIISNCSDIWHWVARDANGTLGFYKNVPKKGDDAWFDSDDNEWLDFSRDVVRLFEADEKDIFSFVKWEDEKPWDIKKLKWMIHE